MMSTLSEEGIRRILADNRAIIIDDHFVYKSRLHGHVYVNKDAVYVRPSAISALCGQMAKQSADREIDVVVGPAIGGIIISQWTASHLSLLTGRQISSVFVEKPTLSGPLVIKRGYDAVVKGHRVLIVHDTSVQDDLVKGLVRTVETLNGRCVGICDVTRYDAMIHADALMAYSNPTDLSGRCKGFVNRNLRLEVDVVLGVSNSGAILSQWMAHHFSEILGHEVLAVFAEYAEQSGELGIPEQYGQILSGKRVLAVEDILTTGASAKQTVTLAEQAGATVVSVTALANRGNVTKEDLGVEWLRSLIRIECEAWPAPCKLCDQGIPINTELGHGRAYVAEHGQPVAKT
jgi:orotate phosphoribosyltransferase